MAHIGEKLRELLENPELQEALADVFYTGIDSPRQFEEIGLADHLRHARGIHVSDTPFDDLPEKLAKVIQSLVIDRLPQPVPITLDDLTSLAIAHLAGIDLSQASKDESLPYAYERFVTCAVLEIGEQRYSRDSETFHSLGSEWGMPEEGSSLANFLRELCGVDSNEILPSEYTRTEIWRSESGFSLNCIVEGYLEDSCERVYGKFEGYCTERALQHVETLFKGLIGSIAKTVELCDGDYPPITFLVGGDGQRVLAACLSACCHSPGSEGATIQDRLRNAIVLLSHADSAPADPISLSLSFAAIEALLCEKGELPVNKQIERDVSTLLVQDDGERKDREVLEKTRKGRGNVLGKLYDIRCQVMHGNQVNASDKAAECVRKIAAAAVRGVVSWMENQERMGADTSWKEFMDEINAASRKPGIIVGVPDLSELIPAKVPR